MGPRGEPSETFRRGSEGEEHTPGEAHVINQNKSKQLMRRTNFAVTNKAKETRLARLGRRCNDRPRMMSLRLPSQGVHSFISYYSCPRYTINPLSMRRMVSLHHAKLPSCTRSQFGKVTYCSHPLLP
jgi:hypothetical protein